MEELVEFSKMDAFIAEKVNLLLSHINVDKDRMIFVDRNTMDLKNNKAIFFHNIYVCPPKQFCENFWNDTELFINKGDNLFLYLKGRLLIQNTTTWTIYNGDSFPLSKRYELVCNYSLKGK